MYSYHGWTPEIEHVREWWTQQHTINPSSWQMEDASSWGSKYRATLVYLQRGNIQKEVFNVVAEDSTNLETLLNAFSLHPTFHSEL
jgi:hypothetical protein